MTYAEYSAAMARRAAAVSRNLSRRMRGLPPLPLPPKPIRPLVPICYEPDGTYGGRLTDPSDAPEGYSVKWEPALY